MKIRKAVALNAKPASRFPANIPIIRSTFSMSPYGRVDSLAFRAGEIRRPIVDFIHRQGGRPPSTTRSSPPPRGWEERLRTVARYLLTIGGAGADILEVGYGSLAASWPTTSPSGTPSPATVCSSPPTAPATTTRARTGGVRRAASTPAPGRPRPDRAQPAGRPGPRPGATSATSGSFRGTIDMTLDSVVPMGAVAVTAPQTPVTCGSTSPTSRTAALWRGPPRGRRPCGNRRPEPERRSRHDAGGARPEFE